jgi:hypothetical protein
MLIVITQRTLLVGQELSRYLLNVEHSPGWPGTLSIFADCQALSLLVVHSLSLCWMPSGLETRAFLAPPAVRDVLHPDLSVAQAAELSFICSSISYRSSK